MSAQGYSGSERSTRLLVNSINEMLKARRRDEPTVTPNLPRMPAWLDPRAKRIWKRLGAKLLKVGLISDLDADLFAGLFRALSDAKAKERFGF